MKHVTCTNCKHRIELSKTLLTRAATNQPTEFDCDNCRHRQTLKYVRGSGFEHKTVGRVINFKASGHLRISPADRPAELKAVPKLDLEAGQ